MGRRNNLSSSSGLWLNLTDGSIACGRKMWDGSGGNNHAKEHFDNTGYPLVVKLGTISADGGDVYSYAEDDMVLDPKLDEHLRRWGIDLAGMKKTEKTMAELEIEWNQKVGDFSKLTESDKKLQSAYGPELTGMENLGNSCYMNSIVQVGGIVGFVRLFTTFARRSSSHSTRLSTNTTATTNPMCSILRC